VVAAILLVISVVLALLSAPSDAKAVTAQMMGEIIEWIIEAPYVMQAANDLKVHLGWAVQIYNAAEALPNLINPFWMLPLLGVVGLKPRDIVGFTFLQFVVHVPVVLFLLWFFAGTLIYMPPVIPH
jgi:short-chain fatty acids transporter